MTVAPSARTASGAGSRPGAAAGSSSTPGPFPPGAPGRAAPGPRSRARAGDPRTPPAARRVAAVLLVAGLLAAGTGLTARQLQGTLGGAGRLVLDEGRPWVAPAAPPGQGTQRRVVTLVTAPGLDLALLHRLAATDPTWQSLLQGAAAGLMTAHTGGYYGREAAYLTLGAGARAVSGPTAGWVLPGDQVLAPGTAASLFDRWWPGPSGTPPGAEPALAGSPAPASGTEGVRGSPERNGGAQAAGGPEAGVEAAGDGAAGGAAASTGLPGLPPVVHWGGHALQRANQDLDHPVPLGSLAAALHAAGLKVAALGNADLPSGPWASARPGAALLAADGRGRVDLGLVDGRALEPDPSFPGGWRTRWDTVLDAWALARRQAALVVVEEGDLARLEDLAPLLPAGTLETARWEAARRLGRALAVMRAGLGPEDRLILLNPAPGSEARATGETLMPVITWGAGSGLLASPSTRRAGVVANTDLAPMIAAHLAAPPHPAWVGRPWLVVPGEGPPGAEALAGLHRLDAGLVVNYQRRAAFIRLFVGAGLVLTAGPLLGLWRRSRRLGRWVQPLLALAAFPLANLLLPAWPAGPGWSWWSGTPSVLLAALLAVALAALARRLAGSTLGAFGAVGFWTAVVTVADALAGAWLAQLTPFGYSPIGGARFYGIGNEYMGVLIGSAAVAAAAWAEMRRRAAAAAPGHRRRPGWQPARPPMPGQPPAGRSGRPSAGAAAVWLADPKRLATWWRLPAALGVPLTLGAVAAVLASPRLGSNFGGALSAAVAACGPALASALAARRQRLRRRAAAGFLLLGAPVAAGLLMALWDRQLGAGATHVLATWEQVESVGPGALADVVVRKIGMNLRLMRYTNWSYLFVMLVFAYAFVIYRRAAVVRRLERSAPEAVRGLAAVAAGSLAALLLNDSGIVAAATTLVYGATLLLALAAGLESPGTAPLSAGPPETGAAPRPALPAGSQGPAASGRGQAPGSRGVAPDPGR
ncbi:hypothetical protein ThesuDRAFT_00148 [Thermaerobacter subterraneus DSM 13965]|uniref:Uncharacterized protein n=1 Tax=Thermaerobacter subterraneus DSM 13965 TaxID=867903 RepID=K6PYT2_9FIRM|nr:hypothetical protein ThesuDRAFT_00148 [Thermaerobacter subterraneus DSM 13965]